MASGTFKAVVCRHLGDPTAPFSDSSALHITELPRQQLPSPTSVRVAVKAASVNFANILVVQGQYQERPPLPFVPGSDFSGVVLEVGSAVTDIQVGDPVCGMVTTGAYAQELVADQQRIFAVPSNVDLTAAAGFPVAFGTSHLGLIHRANLHAGQVLLVLGAAGGVGLAAVQIGKVVGATVIAVARGIEKAEFLRSVGADLVVDSSDGNMVESVKGFLKSNKLRGVDVFYDPVGGKLFKEGLKLLNWGAQVVIVGFASGQIPSVPANIALVKNATFHGLFWGSHFQHNPEVVGKSMQELISWLEKGIIRVHVSHRFDVSESNIAHATIQQRQVVGKVLITFDESDKSAETQLSKL